MKPTYIATFASVRGSYNTVLQHFPTEGKVVKCKYIYNYTRNDRRYLLAFELLLKPHSRRKAAAPDGGRILVTAGISSQFWNRLDTLSHSRCQPGLVYLGGAVICCSWILPYRGLLGVMLQHTRQRLEQAGHWSKSFFVTA